MWLTQKSRNRRVGREHVLYVKVRSSQVRATRLRLALVMVAVIFGTVLGVALRGAGR